MKKLSEEMDKRLDMASFVFIKITDSCNKNCSFCYYANNKNPKSMTLETFKSLVEKVGDERLRKVIFGGEPTTHSDFLKFCEYLFERKEKVYFITNLLCDIELLKSLSGLQVKYDGSLEILINGHELSGERRQKFKKNLEFLYSLENVTTGTNIVLNLHEPIEKLKAEIDDVYGLFGEKINIACVVTKVGNIKYVGVPSLGKTMLACIKHTQSLFKNSNVRISHKMFRCNFDDDSEWNEYSSYLAPSVYSLGYCGTRLLDETYLASCIYGNPEVQLEHKNYETIVSMLEDLDRLQKEKIATYLPDVCRKCKHECKKIFCSMLT